MSDQILAALIGALAALMVALIKDIILDDIRLRRESKKALIDRKLSQLYSPLWVALGGGANALGGVLSDDVYPKLTANFHLLSHEIRVRMEEFMKLGRGDTRNPRFNSDEMDRVLELGREITNLLRSEIDQLRTQYITL